MIGTVIAVVLALLLHFTNIGRDPLPNVPALGIILITVASLFLIIPTLAIALAWSPLQYAEQSLTPRVTELFRKDYRFKLILLILLLFPLLSFLFAIDLLFLDILNRNVVLPVWLVLFGISIDALYALLKRISAHLDPFQVVEFLGNDAHKNIQESNEIGVCNNIEAQSEIAIHAIQRASTSLCNEVLDSLQNTARIFFESYKSISHPATSDQDKKAGISDTVSYTLFFLLQRLEMINEKAADLKLEPVSSKVITATGKIVIASAKYDMSMPSYPLQAMGKFAIISLRHGVLEVGPKAVSTFLAVARAIVTEIDITYAELQEPFLSLIGQLHEVTKEMFRQDKSINLKVLMQPFLDLKELFQSEKMAAHQDTPVIVNDIDRVLAEYGALAEVMRTMPAIPKTEIEQ